MEIKEIKADELHNLYQYGEQFGNYKPLGLFWRKDGDKYIGIDNSNGDAWTEEFKTKEAMLRWLEGWEEDEVCCPICGSYEVNHLELEHYVCKNTRCKCTWNEIIRKEADIL